MMTQLKAAAKPVAYSRDLKRKQNNMEMIPFDAQQHIVHLVGKISLSMIHGTDQAAKFVKNAMPMKRYSGRGWADTTNKAVPLDSSLKLDVPGGSTQKP